MPSRAPLIPKGWIGARFAVSNRRRAELTDPDFEPLPPPARVRLRSFNPRDHQKFVVNPFLAVLGLILLGKLAVLLVFSGFPPFAISLIIPLAFLPHLIQFHCLDCGKTGRYLRKDHHACSTIHARWDEDRSSKFPSSKAQLTLWAWLLGSAAILILVLWL
jgi:hypothetical protein